jgi:hypothetical protein
MILASQLPSCPRAFRFGGVDRSGSATSFTIAMRRSLEVAKSLAAGDVGSTHAIEQKWTHAVSALVEWHSKYSSEVDELEVDQSVVGAAIKLALDWQKLETLRVGLLGKDVLVDRSVGRNVWLRNRRDAGTEVLDINLAQVTVPPSDFYTPTLAPVVEWFEGNRGRRDLIHDIPPSVHTRTWQWAQLRLATQGTTISVESDLGGLTLAEARSCYAVLIATCHLNHLSSVLLEAPQALLWFIRPGALLAILAARVGRAAATSFIAMCTFVPGRNPVSAPLVPSGEFVMIPSDLISPTAFERTLLRAAASDPARGGKLGNLLGQRALRWAERLRCIPGVVVFERVVVRQDGVIIGDLDVVAYDSTENFALVFETKWPIDAATLSDSYKVDAQFDSGREQVRKVRAAIADGAVIHWPRSANVPNDVDTSWWVGSAQQLDTRLLKAGEDIGSTSLRLVEHLLPCPTLAELDDRLRNPPMPVRGRDYKIVEQTVNAGELRLRFPAIELDPHMPVPPSERRIHNGWT